jgi:hypothetical protein
MASRKGWILSGISRQTLTHSIRTALAATVSLYVARFVRMPEAYWAAITTLVVMQSTLGLHLGRTAYRFASITVAIANQSKPENHRAKQEYAGRKASRHEGSYEGAHGAWPAPSRHG